MARKRTTERIELPAEYVALADRRVADFLHACAYDSNVLENLMRSCYLQGVYDGAQVAANRPELIALFQDAPAVPVVMFSAFTRGED